MKVSSYKNILFIEENINVETLNKERFEIKTSGFVNQLKNLNDLKEQIYIKIANSSQKYNVVYNFRYGQKQNIIALDDIAFYASGVLAQIGNEDYEKIKKLIDSSSLSLQYLLKNQKFYSNMPVQVDKVALYKIKNKYVGQCKLINFSEEEIREVKLELQSVNSFGEMSDNLITCSILRKKEDSNFLFGDDKTIVFSEEDISNYKFKILSVRTDEKTYIYNEENLDYIPRDKILSDIMNEDEFNYLIEIKYNSLFKKKSIQYNSIIPFKYGNMMIDFDGEIRKLTDADNLSSFINYIENDLHTDYEAYIKLEQEKETERLEKIKIATEEKKQKQDRLKNKIRTILKIGIPSIIVLMLIFGTIGIIKEKKDENLYNQATQYIKTGQNYEEAIEIFEKLGDYKDSKKYYQTTKLAVEIIEDFQSKNYFEALKNINVLVDEEFDVEASIKDVCNENVYIEAVENYNNSNLDEAQEMFNELNDYKDSSTYKNNIELLINFDKKWEEGELTLSACNIDNVPKNSKYEYKINKVIEAKSFYGNLIGSWNYPNEKYPTFYGTLVLNDEGEVVAEITPSSLDGEVTTIQTIGEKENSSFKAKVVYDSEYSFKIGIDVLLTIKEERDDFYSKDVYSLSIENNDTVHDDIYFGSEAYRDK